MKTKIIIQAWFLAALMVLVVAAPLHAANHTGIVNSVVKSPVSSDGTTSGRSTDFVINLDSALNPNVAGRTLLKGKTIRITLPNDFRETAGNSFSSIGPDCVLPLGSAKCNTAVLLQGWPQHPIAPPAMKYDFDYEPTTNTVIYTAREDLVPATPLEPGIKQMHLLLLGFTNPRPGVYRLKIDSETGPDGALESGWATVKILQKSRHSINVTSTGTDNPTRLNTIFQQTTVGSMAPLNYNFLLWDRNDQPFSGLDLIERQNNRQYLLKNGNKVVGSVRIDAPAGAEGQSLISFGESVPANTPIIGTTTTARWVTKFIAGSEPGLYSVVFKLHGGNSATMYVNVTE